MIEKETDFIGVGSGADRATVAKYLARSLACFSAHRGLLGLWPYGIDCFLRLSFDKRSILGICFPTIRYL
jgi:hypothetical protein